MTVSPKRSVTPGNPSPVHSRFVMSQAQRLRQNCLRSEGSWSRLWAVDGCISSVTVPLSVQKTAISIKPKGN